MFLFCSYGVKRPKAALSPPWRVETVSGECMRVVDASGFVLASVYFRDDLQNWSFGSGHLTKAEARRIANGITRLLEFLMQRRGFFIRAAAAMSDGNRAAHTTLLLKTPISAAVA